MMYDKGAEEEEEELEGYDAVCCDRGEGEEMMKVGMQGTKEND